MSAYIPPTENVPIFDPSLFSSNSSTLTQDQADKLYLKYPTAQGTENLQSIVVAGTASFTNSSPPTSTATQPASTDSSTNIPTTAWVQSAIASGGSTTLTSNAVGTNSWTITIPNTFGRAFSFTLYTDLTPSTYSVSNAGTTSISAGAITSGFSINNPSFVVMTGNAYYQPYQATSNTQITYCAGFQQQYTYSASGGAYLLYAINSMGANANAFGISVYSGSVAENNNTCPPSASGSFTTSYTFTLAFGSVASCYLKMKITPLIT